ncbi:MAG: alkaline phosphatase, partial [Myxococcales bacterium]|nr:alkaline phosphatase [Myxococcales bacterium]
PLPTVLEKAKARGMATGLVTTTRVTDATPAAFAAHVPSRKMEAEIAVQMLRDAEPDVLLGGGGRFWIPAGTRAGEALPFDDAAGARETSKREDALNLVDEARERGYRVVAQAADLEKAARDPGARRILGLFTASEIPYAIDRGGEPEAPPSLPAMTAAALACLERAPKGFFLMVEGARIDHAGHQNDAAAMLGELREFDAALGVAFDYARRRRDTLVVVVADHDTGGFGFTYRLEAPDGAPKAGGGEGFDFAPFSVLEQLSRQQMSFERIVREARGDPVRLADLVRKATGFSLAAEDATDVLSDVTHATGLVRLLAVGAKDQAQARTVLLARALTESTNVVWASAAHTSTPIVVAAYGPGMARLGGIYPNTHIAEVIGDR